MSKTRLKLSKLTMPICCKSMSEKSRYRILLLIGTIETIPLENSVIVSIPSLSESNPLNNSSGLYPFCSYAFLICLHTSIIFSSLI